MLHFLIVGGLLATIVSFLGVAGLRVWAERHQVLDVPNERSSHTNPTPRGGGLAVVATTLVGWLPYALFMCGESWPRIAGYVIGGVLIAAVSWVDDLRSLPSPVRLAAHTVSALLVVAAIGHWQQVSVPPLGIVQLGWLGGPLTLLWIVGLTNAYNFMDGIDGIAGSQAVVAGLGWTVLGWLAGRPAVATLGLLVAAASLGFLSHNWPPARIFMGDVGSAFLGYTFAVLPLLASPADSRMAVTSLLFVWPFVFDPAFTLLRRLRRGENVFVAHRSHLYQRLVIAGASHLTVTLLYAALASLGVVAAFCWLCWPSCAPFLVVALAALCAIPWLLVRCTERPRGCLRRIAQLLRRDLS